jgi:hypothetical protein
VLNRVTPQASAGEAFFWFFSVFLVGDKKRIVWNIYKPIHSGKGGFSPCYTHSYKECTHTIWQNGFKKNPG